jgi:hypothetical protein
MIKKMIPKARYGCGVSTKIRITATIAKTNPFHQLLPKTRNPAAITPHYKKPVMADQMSYVKTRMAIA